MGQEAFFPGLGQDLKLSALSPGSHRYTRRRDWPGRIGWQPLEQMG